MQIQLRDLKKHELPAVNSRIHKLSVALKNSTAKGRSDSMVWAMAQDSLRHGIAAIAGDSLPRLHAHQSLLASHVGDVEKRTTRNKATTWGVAAALLAMLAAAFLLLRRRTGDLFGRLKGEWTEDRRAMEERMVKLDADLLKVLEKHPLPPPGPTPPTEADHSLALKVADEITRIEQNLTQMDATVRGHKQLMAAVKRMHENLQAAGYQLPALLGKPYDEGLKVTAAFITDENYEKDQRIITRVFKPTVIHNGRMIQAGDVQVTQG